MRLERKNDPVVYTEAFKKELDRRLSAYLNGSSRLVTASESKKRIRQIKENPRLKS